jgi:hypothetical protein
VHSFTKRVRVKKHLYRPAPAGPGHPSTLPLVVTLDAALAAGATLVASAFALALLERWLIRRRPHELAWTVSLAMFAIASGALWLAEARHWSAPTFRTFYLFGAILNVPWLAMGTVYLLAGRRFADGVRWGLVLASGFAAGVVVSAPLRAPVPPGELPEGRALFAPLPRVLAAVGSGVAAVVVIGGALWSAWRLWRAGAVGSGGSGRPPATRLVVGNLVIAAGTLVLSASGTLAGRLGKDRAFAVTLVAGIVILFAGFLIATPGRPRPVEPVATGSLASELAS